MNLQKQEIIQVISERDWPTTREIEQKDTGRNGSSQYQVNHAAIPADIKENVA